MRPKEPNDIESGVEVFRQIPRVGGIRGALFEEFPVRLTEYIILIASMQAGAELIRGYLETTDSVREEELLSALLFEQAAPLIRKTVWRRLMTSPEPDREDVAGEVMVELTSRLQRLKAEDAAPIERFEAYVVVAAHNACDQYLRQRYPQRHRLKNRLRYLLSKLPNLALWEDMERGWVCGRAAWKDRAPVPVSPELSSKLGSRDRPPEEVLTAVFDQTGGPVDFDGLTSLLAVFWGVRDSVTPLETVEHVVASKDPGIDVLLAQKQSVARLWSEIEDLPPAQRAALLLNLREPSGAAAAWLLPAGGIASVRRIAELVGIPAEEFADLWGRLPLSDLEIAAKLGVGRQQVINLRQAARQRLGRRLRDGSR